MQTSKDVQLEMNDFPLYKSKQQKLNFFKLLKKKKV